MRKNYTVDQVHDLTMIDKWFLYKLMDIVETQHELEAIGSLPDLRKDLFLKAKQQGFSDIQIALAVDCTEDEVRSRRKALGLKPWVKKIDTLAAEFPAEVRSPTSLRWRSIIANLSLLLDELPLYYLQCFQPRYHVR